MPRRVSVGTAVLGLLVLCAVGCGRGKQPSAASKSPPDQSSDSEIVSGDIWSDYGENPAAADAKYLGKRVEWKGVRGQDRVIRKADDGRYFVGDQFQDMSIPNVIRTHPHPKEKWFVAASEVPKLAAVKPEQAFTLRGICRGRRDNPAALKGYQVIVEESSITFEN